MSFCLQALENISQDDNSLTKSYSSDDEDMVEDADDTSAYDGQFYEVFYLNHSSWLKTSNSVSFFRVFHVKTLYLLFTLVLLILYEGNAVDDYDDFIQISNPNRA